MAVCHAADTCGDPLHNLLADVGDIRVQGCPLFFLTGIVKYRVAPPSRTPARLCHRRVFPVRSNVGDRNLKILKKVLHIQFVEEPGHLVPGGAAQRDRERQVFGT